MCDKAIYAIATSIVESLHCVMRMFAPKRCSFLPVSYTVRVMIATMRFNENVSVFSSLSKTKLFLYMSTYKIKSHYCSMREGCETTEYMTTGKNRFGVYTKFTTRRKHLTLNYAREILDEAVVIARTRMLNNETPFVEPTSARRNLAKRSGTEEDAYYRHVAHKIRREQEKDADDMKFNFIYRDFLQRPKTSVHIPVHIFFGLRPIFC